MIPYSDRLLIFKPDSVWALFGYDAETWELTNISRTVGCVHQQAICRNEAGVFFLSWPQGIFAYSERGNVTEMSVPDPGRRSRTTASTPPRSTTSGSAGSTDACGARCRSRTSPRPTMPRTVFVWDPVLSENGLMDDVPRRRRLRARAVPGTGRRRRRRAPATPSCASTRT